MSAYKSFNLRTCGHLEFTMSHTYVYFMEITMYIYAIFKQ